MITLRPYQNSMVDAARSELKKHPRILLQGPTGCGKTAITVFMMSRAAEQNKNVIFIVHQNELLTQTSRALWKQKLEHGVIASGKTMSRMPVQVASVQTLVNRLNLIESPDLIIIDEAHRSAAATYKKILDYFPNAKVIGLTATPQRTDGKGLDDLFLSIINGPSIRQLIEAGYLCDYEIYAPKLDFDIDDVKTIAGDYSKNEIAKELDKPTITGDAVNHYNKLCKGKRCVVMCATINHANHVCDQYISCGIPAACIDGRMTNAERDKLLKKFASGEILVICNVQLLIEGVDIPSIEVVQWLRPTKSLIVFMQGNGRGLRPSEGKEKLIILDHVENWKRHGLPCQKREWSLNGNKKKSRKKDQDQEKDINVQQCRKCYAVFLPGPDICPHCKSPIEKQERKIKVEDGELEKIDMSFVKKQNRIEQGKSRTLEDLVSLGIRRGMQKAPQWAAITMASRQKRKPTSKDFSDAMRIYEELRSA